MIKNPASNKIIILTSILMIIYAIITIVLAALVFTSGTHIDWSNIDSIPPPEYDHNIYFATQILISVFIIVSAVLLLKHDWAWLSGILLQIMSIFSAQMGYMRDGFLTYGQNYKDYRPIMMIFSIALIILLIWIKASKRTPGRQSIKH